MTSTRAKGPFEFKLKFDGVKIADIKLKKFQDVKDLIDDLELKF